jgi:hypothetical protein
VWYNTGVNRTINKWEREEEEKEEEFSTTIAINLSRKSNERDIQEQEQISLLREKK